LLVQIRQHVRGYLPAACETRLRAERSRKSSVGVPTNQAADPALRAEESQRALEHFRELCLSRLDDAQPLEAAFKSLQRCRLDAQADALVEDLIKSAAASPFLGALWVRRR